jgi:hypothetical protein
MTISDQTAEQCIDCETRSNCFDFELVVLVRSGDTDIDLPGFLTKGVSNV